MLWKITGTGQYFSDFYVEADRESMAYARAQDILNSGYRTREDKYKIRYCRTGGGRDIESYIRSVTPFPASQEKKMSTISENPKLANEFLAGKTEKDFTAAKAVIKQFRKRLPELSDDQLSEVFILFGGLLGMLTEEPRTLLGLVDAFSVLINGEQLMVTAACLVYPEYQKQ